MIVVDPKSPVPPYEQVRSHYAALIARGELVAGAKLPTVRQLAADLGLAVNTAARAYRELEASGLIETRGRAGTVVSAQGSRAISEAVEAAKAYAIKVSALGISSDEALGIVRAALGR
ncbi:MAG TPA: GntR family transcriptional regulator [Jatrophihabitans sp.]|jgi:DNA-binding transcriptional regulator YhcF (GntR family)